MLSSDSVYESRITQTEWNNIPGVSAVRVVRCCSNSRVCGNPAHTSVLARAAPVLEQLTKERDTFSCLSGSRKYRVRAVGDGVTEVHLFHRSTGNCSKCQKVRSGEHGSGQASSCGQAPTGRPFCPRSGQACPGASAYWASVLPKKRAGVLKGVRSAQEAGRRPEGRPFCPRRALLCPQPLESEQNRIRTPFLVVSVTCWVPRHPASRPTASVLSNLRSSVATFRFHPGGHPPTPHLTLTPRLYDGPCVFLCCWRSSALLPAPLPSPAPSRPGTSPRCGR